MAEVGILISDNYYQTNYESHSNHHKNVYDKYVLVCRDKLIHICQIFFSSKYNPIQVKEVVKEVALYTNKS